MKKSVKVTITISLALVLCLAIVLVVVLALPKSDDDPIELGTPVVTISASGVASWATIDNALSYKYVINDGEERDTDGASVQLAHMECVKVKAVGDGTKYLDSAFSDVQTYIDRSEPYVDVDVLLSKYVQPTQMPYYAEWLDKDYPRQQNVTVSNEGLSSYPSFGAVFSTQNSQARADVYNENVKLTSGFTSFYGGGPSGNWAFYNMMDKDGNLLKIDLNTASSPADAVDSGMDLYKHTAAEGMYFGNVSDSEPAVVKRITTNGKQYGTIVTGLYAPAGEVVKVEMPADSLRDRNIYISIGQTLGNGTANAIPARTDKKFVRMPIISTRFRMNKKTSYYDANTDTYSFYIGSHFGGPIYLLPNDVNSKSDVSEFTFTISGAVNYRHYILGVTTKEEFDYVSKSSAPYFDMEVSWNEGVRHSGPLKFASMFDYEQLTNAAVLWEKIGLISNQFPNWCATGGNIVYAYDDYVVSGAAVALCGNRTVDAPYDWMTGSLNYDYFVTNGSWGNVHEYNHHYQKFGLSGDSNEITNNAVNLLEYALFTKISSQRTLDGGLGGWNAYTAPQYGLQYLVNTNAAADDSGASRVKQDSLHVYAAILHNIGADAFIASGKSGSNPDGYYKNLCNGTHLDMTYFFNEVLNFATADAASGNTISAASVDAVKAKDYPMFVPVNTVYQVGKIWEKDGVKQYARTAQPFVYGVGDFMLDFANYLVIPQGFTYKIKSVTQPKNGSIEMQDNLHLLYKPNEQRLSGEFIVTLQVTKDDGAFQVADVQLILNLEQANILQRTTWSYTEENMPSVSSVDDLIAVYEGLKPTDANAKVGSNINPVQNGNTEIWGGYNSDPRSIMEIKGSLFINSDGKYRIALRGRRYAVLYLSYDGGKTYEDMIKLTYHESGADFMPNDYVDVNLISGHWVDFKAVLLNDYANAYIGVGIGKFGADTDGTSASETVSISYANAYKDENYLPTAYVAPSYATPHYDYFYNETYSEGQTLVDSKYACSVNDNPKYNLNVDYSLGNVFDEDENNCFWSTGNTYGENSYSVENPFEITVDIGKIVEANTFTIYYPAESGFAQYYATAFKVYAGKTLEEMTLAYETNYGDKTYNAMVVTLEKPIKLRYYKLVVSNAKRADKQFALRKLEWSYSAMGEVFSANAKVLDYYENDVVAERDAVKYTGEWKQKSAFGFFGTVNVGGAYSSATFRFEGTQIAVFSELDSRYGSYDIYIDGERVYIADISEGSGVEMMYLSETLQDGEHTVIIRGNTGNFNIDSFVVF